MDYLSDVHIDDLQFLVGNAVVSIEIGKYQIGLELEEARIAVYSKVHYTDQNGEISETEAEGKKIHCPFTEILDKKIRSVSLEKPSYLVLAFEDDTRLKIWGDGAGYEAFLINTPDGILVFR